MDFEHSLTECILEREIAKTVFRERERERDRKIASFFVGIIDLRKQKLKAFWASKEATGFSFDPTASSLSLSLSHTHLDFSSSSSLSHALCTQMMGIFLVLCEDFCGF